MTAKVLKLWPIIAENLRQQLDLEERAVSKNLIFISDGVCLFVCWFLMGVQTTSSIWRGVEVNFEAA